MHLIFKTYPKLQALYRGADKILSSSICALWPWECGMFTFVTSAIAFVSWFKLPDDFYHHQPGTRGKQVKTKNKNKKNKNGGQGREMKNKLCQWAWNKIKAKINEALKKRVLIKDLICGKPNKVSSIWCSYNFIKESLFLLHIHTLIRSINTWAVRR